MEDPDMKEIGRGLLSDPLFLAMIALLVFGLVMLALTP